MALDINQANIGYSTTGISDFINELNVQVIQALITEMHNTIPSLREVVDEVWVGQSANAFKDKLERDTSTMVDTLNKIEDNLRGQFAQIAQNVDNYDASIAESINSGQ